MCEEKIFEYEPFCETLGHIAFLCTESESYSIFRAIDYLSPAAKKELKIDETFLLIMEHSYYSNKMYSFTCKNGAIIADRIMISYQSGDTAYHRNVIDEIAIFKETITTRMQDAPLDKIYKPGEIF